MGAQGVANEAAAAAVSAKVNATLDGTRGAFARSTNLTCAVFATKVEEVSIQVTGAPLLASLGTMLTALAEATVATCSDDDKLSLGNASATFDASTESITLAVAEKQAALNISTGATVSTDGLTVAPTTVGTTGTTTTGTTTTGTTGTTTTVTTTTGTTTTGTTTTGTTSTTTTGTTTTGTTTTGTTSTTTTAAPT